MCGRPRLGCQRDKKASAMCREFVSLVPWSVCGNVRVMMLVSASVKIEPAGLKLYARDNRMVIPASKFA